jgi:6-phosphogluconolactonase
MTVDIRVVDDPQAELAQLLELALAAGGPVVLTGGSTVKAYAAVKPRVWSGAQLWFSDERAVPAHDPNSNYGAIKAGLLDPLAEAGVTVGAVHRVRGEQALEAAASTYEGELLELASSQGQLSFELLVLGLGPDGHIASMFPNQDSLDEQTALALAVPEAGLAPFVPRVTLTFPAIAAAKHVVVMAAGAGKADALAHAFADDAPASREVPASLLPEWVQELTVISDEDGASRL